MQSAAKKMVEARMKEALPADIVGSSAKVLVAWWRGGVVVGVVTWW